MQATIKRLRLDPNLVEMHNLEPEEEYTAAYFSAFVDNDKIFNRSTIIFVDSTERPLYQVLGYES